MLVKVCIIVISVCLVMVGLLYCSLVIIRVWCLMLWRNVDSVLVVVEEMGVVVVVIVILLSGEMIVIVLVCWVC